MAVSENVNGMADCVIELSDEELAALKRIVKQADGRKAEVKLAKKTLGL